MQDGTNIAAFSSWSFLLLLAIAPGCATLGSPSTMPVQPEGPVVRHVVMSHGAARSRTAARDDADLVLFYGGEQRGSLETCGCPRRPRGSLARVAGYRQVAERGKGRPPTVLVNTGHWLEDTIGVDGTLRADVEIMNDWMLRGLEQGEWDVLNVSYRELPYLDGLKQFPDGAVSANAVPSTGRGPAPYVLLEREGITVGVTGVTRPADTFLLPERFSLLDPVESLSELLPELAQKADLVVVLGFELSREEQHAIAGRGDVDVFIEASGYLEQWEPFVKGRTVWLRSHLETQRLGELRIKVGPEGIQSALDRKVDLDKAIPEPGSMSRISRTARKAIDQVQVELFGS